MYRFGIIAEIAENVFSDRLKVKACSQNNSCLFNLFNFYVNFYNGSHDSNKISRYFF